jgi:flagellin-specific chaperone FliS
VKSLKQRADLTVRLLSAVAVAISGAIVFCSRSLRRSNIDGSAGTVEEVQRIVAQIRQRWPKVRISAAR